MRFFVPCFSVWRPIGEELVGTLFADILEVNPNKMKKRFSTLRTLNNEKRRTKYP
jgi:hypothetical protein